MEELVGKIWDRLITRSSEARYPEAAVTLEEMRGTVGIFFRALGGYSGLRVEAVSAHAHSARRTWLQRIAGSNRRVELCWRDHEALWLPSRLDVFADRALNRDLYLWLAALASEDTSRVSHWFVYNQWLTCKVLRRFPGLRGRYQRLADAHIRLRPEASKLNPAEASQEAAIQQALRTPGLIAHLPEANRSPQPVHLWLHPSPPRVAHCDVDPGADAEPPEQGGELHQPANKRRRKAERVDMPDGNRGLLLDRFENIFSWAEFVKVDRSTDESDDLQAAEQASEDLDVLSIARDTKASAKRVRFDLDLPAEATDDVALGEGALLPEWDYRRSLLRPDYCRVQPMIAAKAKPCDLPKHLIKMARRLRNQFESLAPSRIWYRGQAEGSEVDLDAYLHQFTERTRGKAVADGTLYRDFRGGVRDLSCLLLADLSLSTDAWVSHGDRVIDVIRDSLFLFSEALAGTGDRFALYGFSSRRRDHVRFHSLKAFNDAYDAEVRGRIAAIKPGFYTRMGAAVRHAAGLLEQEPSAQRLLLLLTDGKPNDLDQYEGRYGVEDTRVALLEAKRKGLQPFCVTIDEEAGDYLPHLFGAGGYVVIRKPSELPGQLPLLYARLTR